MWRSSWSREAWAIKGCCSSRESRILQALQERCKPDHNSRSDTSSCSRGHWVGRNYYDLYFLNQIYNCLKAYSRSGDPECYETCAFPSVRIIDLTCVFNELLYALQHAAASFGPCCIYSVSGLVPTITFLNQ